jgi:transcriptional regulator with XRE-family HTH domain
MHYLSLRQVATRMNVSAGYLCDLELGRRHWNAKQRNAFLKALR